MKSLIFFAALISTTFAGISPKSYKLIDTVTGSTSGYFTDKLSSWAIVNVASEYCNGNNGTVGNVTVRLDNSQCTLGSINQFCSRLRVTYIFNDIRCAGELESGDITSYFGSKNTTTVPNYQHKWAYPSTPDSQYVYYIPMSRIIDWVNRENPGTTYCGQTTSAQLFFSTITYYGTLTTGPDDFQSWSIKNKPTTYTFRNYDASTYMHPFRYDC
jgi:hypothetical protein